MHILTLFPVLATFLSLIHAIPLADQVGAVALGTTSGLITGEPSKFDPDVATYLGIPYALPPTGPRRWTPPERFISNTQFAAIKYGADCPGTLTMPGGVATNEDCLTLNVWVPPATDGRPKAIMVWIYGGAFTGGSAAMAMTDGSNLAKSGDVIVVAMNYRLSILGFPGSPGLATQNLGLLDQRAAVEWTRDNAAVFGGDPERIVLFGQSAGAESVDIYSHAWTQDPIVKGFIGESGASTMCGLVTNTSYSAWNAVTSQLRCNDGDSAKELNCMRTKRFEDIIKAAKPQDSGYPPKFVPSPDGKVVFDNYPERMDQGLFVRAPFIIGNNDKEVGTATEMNNQEFICPAMQIANSRAKYNVPVWRYRFYAGAGGAQASVFAAPIHAAELTLVFGTMRGPAEKPNGFIEGLLTPKQNSQSLSVSNEFQAVWTAFAKNPQNGPTSLGWPRYNPNGDTLVRLAYLNEARSSLTQSDAYDGSCPIVACQYTGAGGTGVTLGAVGGLFRGPVTPNPARSGNHIAAAPAWSPRPSNRPSANAQAWGMASSSQPSAQGWDLGQTWKEAPPWPATPSL